MATSLIHRGPNELGIWNHENGKIGFGFRRLSIVDLTTNGSQPMTSSSGRYKIIFNGEIYNHLELRNNIQNEFKHEKIEWNSRCDTETLLLCIEKWGLKDTLAKLNGMFAIALWDNKNNSLHLIRDRIGEKPLYYGWIDTNTFIFGSELKVFTKLSNFKNKICLKSLSLYLRYMYVPAPLTIYKDIYK